MGRAMTIFDAQKCPVFAINHGRTSIYIDINLLLIDISAPRTSVKLFYFFRQITSRRASTYADRAFWMLFFVISRAPRRAPPLGAARRIGF